MVLDGIIKATKKGVVTGLIVLTAASQLAFTRPNAWVDVSASSAQAGEGVVAEGVILGANGGVELPLFCGNLAAFGDAGFKFAYGTENDGADLVGKFSETTKDYNIGGKAYLPVDGIGVFSIGAFAAGENRGIEEEYGGLTLAQEKNYGGWGALAGVEYRLMDKIRADGDLRFTFLKGENPTSGDKENLTRMNLELSGEIRPLKGEMELQIEGVRIVGEPTTAYNASIDLGVEEYLPNKYLNVIGAEINIARNEVGVWLSAGHRSRDLEFTISIPVTLDGIGASFDIPLGGLQK